MHHRHTSSTRPGNARQASLLPCKLSISCHLYWTKAGLQEEYCIGPLSSSCFPSRHQISTFRELNGARSPD